MSTKKRTVTLKDVAEMVGLSQATVSLALGPRAATSGVAEKTRLRVQKVAAHLNYRPNYIAQSLASGHSNTIGVIVPAISEGYYAMAIAGIEDALQQHEYYFLVSSHQWDEVHLQNLLHMMQQRGVEGVVVVNTRVGDLSIPSVRIGDTESHANAVNIYLDERSGTRQAMHYLHRNGHREIAFFRGDRESTATNPRWQGTLEAAHDLGIRVCGERVVDLEQHRSQGVDYIGAIGYSAAQELLSRGVNFTALLAYNDASAIGAIHAFQDAGLRVPEDVSVIGYDNIAASAYERPRLTTIEQPVRKMGNLATQLLMEMLSGQADWAPVQVEPTLIERQSVQRIEVQ